MPTTIPASIDEYISRFSKDVQKKLSQIRATIKKAVPDADETISYGMPTFKLKGRYLVYFAAHKKHIGIYPVPEGNKTFEKDLSMYKTSGKGTIQFPLDEPLPLALITKIARFRKKQNVERFNAKKKKL